MLDSILNRKKKSININRLLIKRDNQEEAELILDRENILHETKKHFKSFSDSIIDNSQELEDYWIDEYEPISYINEKIYENLLIDISTMEWESTIKDLNAGKTGNLSKITYEIIKFSSCHMKEWLRKFYNEILHIEQIPMKWNEGVIYPIPKPGDWNLDLNKTRPITLLECPRKLLMKILTQRLSKILASNSDIMGEHNFAALPGKSTVEPIHILNNILEDARENSKELWVLMQDMSKAYDLVNRDNLWKAMSRIKIPYKFINIIRNSLINRRNRVITDLGITKEYNMNNGIDQGEIISPLLWVIYYNPLFSKIEKQTGLGYTISHNWKQKLGQYNPSHCLTVEVFNIAYMDDTTWIGNSKDNLEKQLTIADNFNRFNGIRVNAAKSKLLVLNSKIPLDERFIKYGKHESIIYPEVDGTSVRFLGVWISNKFNKNFVLNQTLKDEAQIYNITKSKMITAEQTTYVINAVAIPRIEYKSHLTVFNEAEAKKITMKLRKLLRYKIGLLNTAPNVLLNIKQIYNMIDFYDRQTENHVSNLLLRLNDLGILGLTTEIRLRQLQQKEWLHDCLLEV